MNYTGIDYHKRYSVACTMDAQGRLLKQARIEHNAPEAFTAYFAALDGPSETVIEACWNWGNPKGWATRRGQGNPKGSMR